LPTNMTLLTPAIAASFRKFVLKFDS
jgi:hypothetical protein